MVRKSAKGKVLGKELKLKLVGEERKAVAARRARDDKRWKRVLGKMSAAKKEQYKALTKVTRRGVTRRFLRQRKERKSDTVAYECTIHLSKLLKGRTFHKRAPTAVKKIRDFAQQLMRTKDNRIDGALNTHLWSRGIKGVPGRVRVHIERKVADATEGNKRKQLYSVIRLVDTKSFKNLTTTAAKLNKK
jgi:large subunit ribosomal protein L31e